MKSDDNFVNYEWLRKINFWKNNLIQVNMIRKNNSIKSTKFSWVALRDKNFPDDAGTDFEISFNPLKCLLDSLKHNTTKALSI